MLYVHSNTLTEYGGLWQCTASQLAKEEAQIKTPLAFATSVPGQEAAEKVLKAAGWTDQGHRYNQYHGPNFITLWTKEFPKQTGDEAKPRTGAGYGYGMDCDTTPPHANMCCGLWVRQLKPLTKPEYETPWLALWHLPKAPGKVLAAKLEKLGWKPVAAKLGWWTNADPHDVKNYYGRDRNC